MANQTKRSSDEITDQNLEQAAGGDGGGTGVANNVNQLWGDYYYVKPEAPDGLASNDDSDSRTREDR